MKIEHSSCSTRSRRRNSCLWAGLIAGLICFTLTLHAGPATTTVSDVVYRADGSAAGGTLLISWPAFNTADGNPVAAGSMSLQIGSSGRVSLALAPNVGASPAGTYYKVVLKLADGTTSTEYWVVPQQGPVTITQIRSQVVPQSVAVQMATRQYVDSAIASKADNTGVLHATGDEQVSGVKTFSVSPTVPTPTADTAVANKAYVDTAIGLDAGSFLRKTGDTMSGALTLSGDPTSTNQAANRHYVDTQVATLNGSLVQKLARQGDTPITMGAMRFASQYANIQAAINDAGTNGSVVIPADYNGADSFTNPNNIQVFDMRGDASAFRGFYNVRDFGAKPDDNTDQWAPIQAAINAASAIQPYSAVYVPRGIYHITKPLHITAGIRFYGAGRGSTTITEYAAEQGPMLVVSPPVSLGYAGIPTGPSLVPGPGNSMYLDGTSNYELNLRDGGAVEINGRTSLTMEFFYKPNISGSPEQFNIVSSSGQVTGPDGSTSIAIQHGSNDSVLAVLTVGGSVKVLQSPNYILQAGTVYHIALTYDGATIRLFVNGVLQASQAATGSVTQKMSEDFILGPKAATFLETSFLNNMAKGWVDSVRLSGNARYTANFTPPTAKFTYDGNTMFLLNFDNNYDQFTTATTMYGTQTLFLRRFGGGMGLVGDLRISDIDFIGTGPEFIYTILSMIDNVEVTTSRRGVQFINNCYLNRINSLHVIGYSTAQFAFGVGAASGVLSMEDLALTGSHFPLYTDTAGIVVNGLWIEASEGTEIAAVLKGNMGDSATIMQPEISTETNPDTVRDAMAIIGMGTVVMNGGVISTSNGAPNVYVSGGGQVTHVGGTYSATGTAPATIYQIASPPALGVQLLSPQQSGMNLPWADNVSAIQTALVKTSQSCTGSNKVTGIDSTGAVTCAAAAGYTLTLMNIGTNSPANSTAYYVGADMIDTNNTSFDTAKIQVPKAGSIKRIYVQTNLPSGNLASAESVTHSVCINSNTNCFGSASFAYNAVSTSGSDSTLNQAVNAGDTISIKVQTPAWVTKPTNVRWYAVIYIE